MGIIIDHTPQEEPVENEMSAPNRNTKAGTMPGVRYCSTIWIRNSLVPIPLTMEPKDHAHTRIKGTEISSAIPLTKVSNALVTLKSLVLTPMMPAPIAPPIKAMQIASVMLALRKHPTNPLLTRSPDQKMVAKREPNRQTIGIIKFHIVSL